MEECENDEGNSITTKDGRLSKCLPGKGSARHTCHKVATPLYKFDGSDIVFYSRGCNVQI